MTLPLWFEHSEKMYRRQCQWVVDTIREHCEGCTVEPRHYAMFMECLHTIPKWENAPEEVKTPDEIARYMEAEKHGFTGEYAAYRRVSRKRVLEDYEIQIKEICSLLSPSYP